MSKAEALRAIHAICTAIIEVVQEVGSEGAPSSSIYLTLMEQGITHAQYEQLMSALVVSGKLRQEGHLFFVGEAKCAS